MLFPRPRSVETKVEHCLRIFQRREVEVARPIENVAARKAVLGINTNEFVETPAVPLTISIAVPRFTASSTLALRAAVAVLAACHDGRGWLGPSLKVSGQLSPRLVDSWIDLQIINRERQWLKFLTGICLPRGSTIRMV